MDENSLVKFNFYANCQYVVAIQFIFRFKYFLLQIKLWWVCGLWWVCTI